MACRTASFPTGAVHVPDDDTALNSFAQFVASFTLQGPEGAEIQRQWRQVCRDTGHRPSVSGSPSEKKNNTESKVAFSVPEIMLAFTRTASALELTDRTPMVPIQLGRPVLKNQETKLRWPLARPTEIFHVQRCVE